MALKGSSFLLDNIQWIVLPLVGVLCLVLLVTRVLMTPNAVRLDGQTFSPGAIDSHIERKTDALVANLDSKPQAGKVHRQELEAYVAHLDRPVNVDTRLWPQVPATRGQDEWDGRQYAIPPAPVISDAKAGRLRAAAYMPTEEITAAMPYSQVTTEVNDLDLTTVEAKLDAKALYQGFQQVFDGQDVKPQWRDPCLAKPVFAAVELQRAVQQPDGGWGPWEIVPRAKVDQWRGLLEIVEDVNQLPRGGMKVRMLQYKRFDVVADVLQPKGYDIASADEDWLPPSLHEKLEVLLREQQNQQRRAEIEKARQEHEKIVEQGKRARQSRSRVTTQTGPFGGPLGGAGGEDDSMGMTSEGGTGPSLTGRQPRKQERQEQQQRKVQEKTPPEDPRVQFSRLLLKPNTDLQNSQEPLLFWSYDDTVEPGKTYKYKIRLGVFNPLAGTRELKPSAESYKGQVILWSDFAEAGTVEIPQRLCFFAKDIREAAGTVTVEIFRYALGYWRSKVYLVQPGEVIGRLDEPEAAKEDTKATGGAAVAAPAEKVDFRTGAVFVDAAAVDDWTGGKNLRPRNYFNMYYSYDGDSIESMPVRQRFWPQKMQSLYNDIRSMIKQPVQPFRARGTTTTTPAQQPTFRPAPFEMPPGTTDEGIIPE